MACGRALPVLLLFLSGVAGGCYEPELGACTVACGGAGGDCPDGQSCGSDGYCHAEINDASCRAAQTLAIAANGDDGEIQAATLALEGEAGYGICIGGWYDDLVWGFFRFALVDDLPAESKGLHAELVLYGRGTSTRWSTASDALEIMIEASADARAVVTAGEAPDVPGGRPVGEAVRWPPDGGLTWTNDWNRSPDLGSLLGTLAAEQGGLAAGSHVQLWLRGVTHGPEAEAEVETFDYSEDPSHAARLAIELLR